MWSAPGAPRPPLVFKAQTCQRDALYVGVNVVRCRRNGLANARVRLVPEGFAGRDVGPGRGHLRAEPLERMDAAWPEGGAHGEAQRERDDRPVGAHSSSKLDDAGADFSQVSPSRGASCGTEAAEQRHYRAIHNAVLA